ncbi:MAG: (d)CMP kinase [Verrucomicrobiales bacterium]
MAEVVIAIDGPAASGKSSVARGVAHKLGYVYVNTGLMYRAVTWWACDRGLDLAHDQLVSEALLETKLEHQLDGLISRFAVDGVAAETVANAPVVLANVSRLAQLPGVRSILVELQRNAIRFGSLVMEGRDIGSVVFPNTPYKFYLDASPDVRMARRHSQGVADDAIEARDQLDSQRMNSPLQHAADARVIDTSSLDLDAVIAAVLDDIKTPAS